MEFVALILFLAVLVLCMIAPSKGSVEIPVEVEPQPPSLTPSMGQAS